uniref:Uncharacterized protein n=1 Tax=Rhizophagus irregularis (strain DAOM 181602 / DAOM 197198 / MUCL 43194) TaxID=747089 RepID=U9U5V0_RHIID
MYGKFGMQQQGKSIRFRTTGRYQIDYQENKDNTLSDDANAFEVDILGCRINSSSSRSISFGFTIFTILSHNYHHHQLR